MVSCYAASLQFIASTLLLSLTLAQRVRISNLAGWKANIATIPKEGLMRGGTAVLNGVIHLLDGSSGVVSHSGQLKVRNLFDSSLNACRY